MALVWKEGWNRLQVDKMSCYALFLVKNLEWTVTWYKTTGAFPLWNIKQRISKNCTKISFHIIPIKALYLDMHLKLQCQHKLFQSVVMSVVILHSSWSKRMFNKCHLSCRKECIDHIAIYYCVLIITLICVPRPKRHYHSLVWGYSNMLMVKLFIRSFQFYSSKCEERTNNA